MKTKETNYMNIAIKEADRTMIRGYGGPFGAVVVDSSGNVVAVGSNHVLKGNDPTAHGEIVAIRKACKKLKTHDLSGCVLYTTAYPCPMCLGAIMWANIKEVYYGCSVDDTSNIGFRDNFIYDFIKNVNSDTSSNILKLIPHEKDRCLNLFNKYKFIKHDIY